MHLPRHRADRGGHRRHLHRRHRGDRGIHRQRHQRVRRYLRRHRHRHRGSCLHHLHRADRRDDRHHRVHDCRDRGGHRRDDHRSRPRAGRLADAAACCLASRQGAVHHRGGVHLPDAAGPRRGQAAGRVARRAVEWRTGCCRRAGYAVRAWARAWAGDPQAGPQRCRYWLHRPRWPPGPQAQLVPPRRPWAPARGAAWAPQAGRAARASGPPAWVPRSRHYLRPRRGRPRRASALRRAQSWPRRCRRPSPAWVHRGLPSADGRRAPRRSRMRI
jgi:hypothetical protein